MKLFLGKIRFLFFILHAFLTIQECSAFLPVDENKTRATIGLQGLDNPLIDRKPDPPPLPNIKETTTAFVPFSLASHALSEDEMKLIFSSNVQSISRKIHVDSDISLRFDYCKVVEGKFEIPTMAYVHLVQTVKGLDVDGGDVMLTVVVKKNETRITSREANLFSIDPKIIDPSVFFDKSKFKSKLRGDYDENAIEAGKRKIRWVSGLPKVVQEYKVKNLGLLGIIDNDGEVFVWDDKFYVRENLVKARLVLFNPKATGDNLDLVVLKKLKVSNSYTNEKGEFDLNIDLKDLKLEGEKVKVVDFLNNPLKGNFSDGPFTGILFNPDGNLPANTAQTNAYYHVNLVNEWLADRNMSVGDVQASAIVNFGGACNAFYQPGALDPVGSLYFFSPGKDDHQNTCINTAFDTVIYHEYGHLVDDFYGGIAPYDGLSEGWGDLLSSFVSGQSELGEGMSDYAGYSRSAKNHVKYYSKDEAHTNGQSWSGFAWDIREKFIEMYGQVEGIQKAENLFLPIFIANPPTIPKAMEQVLLRDAGGDPTVAGPHSEIIRSMAEARGILLVDPAFDFTSPSHATTYLDAEIVKGGAILKIEGSVNLKDLDSYSLEWAAGIDPDQGWTNAGIDLSNQGLKKVLNGVLAKWTTPIPVTPGYYTIHLIAHSAEQVSTKTTYVYIDPRIKSGKWPFVIQHEPSEKISISPLPINRNGVGSLVYPAAKKMWEIGSNGQGTSLGEAPLNLYEPTVSQLNQASGESIVSSIEGGVQIFRPEGTIEKIISKYPSLTNFRRILVDDIDGDGEKDVLAQGDQLMLFTRAGLIYLQKFSVSDLNGFPIIFNNQGQKEIISVHARLTMDSPNLGFRVFDANGRVIAEHKTNISVVGLGQPFIADLNHDGTAELVIPFAPKDLTPSFTILNLDGTFFLNKDFVSISGGGKGLPSVRSADLDRDGKEELIVTAANRIYVLTSQGENFSQGWPVIGSEDQKFNNPIIGDINNDGLPEILTHTVINDENGRQNVIEAFDKDGKIVSSWTLPGNEIKSIFPLLTPLGNSGKLSLVVSLLTETPILKTTIYAFDLNVPYNPKSLDWPVRTLDPQNSYNKITNGPRETIQAVDDKVFIGQRHDVLLRLLANDRFSSLDRIQLKSVSNPQYGKVTYTPGFGGEVLYSVKQPIVSNGNVVDHFSYTITNDRGIESVAQVSVAIGSQDLINGNHSPVASDVTFDVPNNLLGQSKIITLPYKDDDSPSVEFLNSRVKNGKLIFPDRYHIQYIPDPDFIGTEKISFRVRDELSYSEWKTMTVNVIRNSPPVITLPKTLTVEIGDFFSFDPIVEDDGVSNSQNGLKILWSFANHEDRFLGNYIFEPSNLKTKIVLRDSPPNTQVGLVLSVSDGYSTTSATVTVTVIPATHPLLTFVAPHTGHTQGNNAVTIFGSNFPTSEFGFIPIDVYFGNKLAKEAYIVSSTKINAITSNDLAGVKDITVIFPSGARVVLPSSYNMIGPSGPETLSPIIQNEYVEMPSQNEVEIMLLANDMDPYGYDLTLSSITQPEKGHVEMLDNKSGVVRYKIDASEREQMNEWGDSFTYEVTNSQGKKATGTCYLYVNNPNINNINFPPSVQDLKVDEFTGNNAPVNLIVKDDNFSEGIPVLSYQFDISTGTPISLKSISPEDGPTATFEVERNIVSEKTYRIRYRAFDGMCYSNWANIDFVISPISLNIVKESFQYKVDEGKVLLQAKLQYDGNWPSLNCKWDVVSKPDMLNIENILSFIGPNQCSGVVPYSGGGMGVIVLHLTVSDRLRKTEDNFNVLFNQSLFQPSPPQNDFHSNLKSQVTVKNNLIFGAKNQSTLLSFSNQERKSHRIEVLDEIGRIVDQKEGDQTIEWNGTTQSGEKLASGAYLVLIYENDSLIDKKKVVIIR